MNFLGYGLIEASDNQGITTWETPPLVEKIPAKQGGGFLTPTSRAQILDPKMDHFLKRFPLSNAPNTQKFQPAAGQNPGSTKSADLTKQRGGFLGRGGGFPAPYPLIALFILLLA